ncbi:hypothetical protein [Nocardia sp. CA-135398]
MSRPSSAWNHWVSQRVRISACVIQATIEREGGDKPACIAEYIVRALA